MSRVGPPSRTTLRWIVSAAIFELLLATDPLWPGRRGAAPSVVLDLPIGLVLGRTITDLLFRRRGSNGWSVGAE